MKSKLEINPSREYDALRQEIIKRIDIHFMIFNINLTISGVLLGIGISNNSLIAMILPPLTLFLVVSMKNNTFSYLKVGEYLRNNYVLENNVMNWEQYNDKFESSKTVKIKRYLFGIGSLGIFITAPLIATAIGLIKYKATLLEKFLITFDILSIIAIILIFIFFSSRRISSMIKKERKRNLEE